MHGGQCVFPNYPEEGAGDCLVLIQIGAAFYFVIDSREDLADCEGQGHGERSGDGATGDEWAEGETV